MSRNSITKIHYDVGRSQPATVKRYPMQAPGTPIVIGADTLAESPEHSRSLGEGWTTYLFYPCQGCSIISDEWSRLTFF
jgi:hypothetical protein